MTHVPPSRIPKVSKIGTASQLASNGNIGPHLLSIPGNEPTRHILKKKWVSSFTLLVWVEALSTHGLKTVVSASEVYVLRMERMTSLLGDWGNLSYVRRLGLWDSDFVWKV